MKNSTATKNETLTLNKINSVEEEYKFLSEYYNEFYDMSYKVVKEYMEAVNPIYTDTTQGISYGGAMFSDLQDYLLLANPEITAICERYNQFRLIKRQFDEIAEGIREIKDSSSITKKLNLVEEQIKDLSKYFEQFKELYDKHIENWELLVDINTTERIYGYWAMFTSAMELYQDKVKLVLSPRIFSMLERMKKKIVTVEELQSSVDYKEIKEFIADVRANKEFLINKVAEVLRTNFKELHKKKTAKLTDVHKVYIDSVNALYEKKYSKLSLRNNIQISLMELDEVVKMLKQDFDKIK